MPLTISFHLSDRDLEFFSERMAEAKAKASALGEGEIAESARRLLDDMRRAELPDFVRERVATLDLMIQMLDDTAWQIEGEDRARIADAIAYVVDPDDIIPDHIPGLGYIDDALMIDMVGKALRDDIEAYQDFCKFRSDEEARRGKTEDPVTQDQWLATRRVRLHERMRRRRASRWKNSMSGGGAPPSSVRLG
jgi:uncharacterized membrane protein YkvA (DUF1232 family)